MTTPALKPRKLSTNTTLKQPASTFTEYSKTNSDNGEPLSIVGTIMLGTIGVILWAIYANAIFAWAIKLFCKCNFCMGD